MSTTFFNRLLAAFAMVALVACGGGDGGDAAQGTPPIANAGPAQAVLAGATAQLDGAASSDAAGGALTYSWTITSTPPGSAVSSSSLAGATSARPTFIPDVAGTYVASLAVGNGQLSSAPATVTVTALQSDGFSIVANKTEPLSGSVQLSLSAPTAGSPVAWYVDLNEIGSGAAVTWNSGSATNSAHQVLARIRLAGTRTVEVRRTVVVSNSSVTISAAVYGTAGTILVDVGAASPFGISSVSAVFDGNPFGTLTAPNACPRTCAGSEAPSLYRFTVDAAAAGSGNHTMVVTAVDATGESQRATVAVPVSNAPTIVLNAPSDGAFAYGTLNVSGSTATDKTGTVTVVVSLRDVPFLTTTAQSFSGSYDLTGLAAGAYILKVTATDSAGSVATVQRTVVNASSRALAYAPIMSPDNGQLLAAEGTQLLYTAADQSVRLRDSVAGTEVTLQGGAIAYANHWQVSGGRVYVQGQGNDCTRNFVCVYQWDATGVRTNLTAANPWAGSSYQTHPVAKSGVVLWCNDGANSYTVFNVAAGTYARVVPAAGVSYVGNTNFDLAVVGGVLSVFYWGQTDGTGTNSTFDVYRWAADTAASTRLSTPGLRSTYVATDGVRAAWSQSPLGSSANTSSLISR